jgi:hypothetical protein
MNLPFTATQFVGVFAKYNHAIGFAPIVAYLAGAAIVLVALLGRRDDSKYAGLLLAAMWAFTGIGYHLISFSAINPAARIFGVVFIVEAALLVFASLRGTLVLRFDRSVRSIFGLAAIAWAMVGYPLVGLLSGHGYPNGPVFGLTPCPLVLFTFGVLAFTQNTPRYLVTPAIMWALVGSTAALALGIREDVSLLITAVAFVALSLQARRAAERLAATVGDAAAAST